MSLFLHESHDRVWCLLGGGSCPHLPPPPHDDATACTLTAVINVIMMHSLCICVVLRWLYCIYLFSSIAASLFSKLTLLYFINTCVNVCMCECCEMYCLLVACHWSWMYQVAHTMYVSPSCSKTFGRQESWCGVVYIFSTTLKATLRLMCDMFFVFFFQFNFEILLACGTLLACFASAVDIQFWYLWRQLELACCIGSFWCQHF